MTDPTDLPAAVVERLRRRDATTRIAVVGASNDPAKYGNVVVCNLSSKGYAVLPVNPGEKEIAGLPSFPDVASAPGPIHVAVFVTPPPVTLRVLQSLDPARIDAVWFQDGSFDDAVLADAGQRFANVVHHACIMVVTAALKA